ncbi:MAG: hypothetical protein WAW69_08375, partial [Polaromonas sp.]
MLSLSGDKMPVFWVFPPLICGIFLKKNPHHFQDVDLKGFFKAGTGFALVFPCKPFFVFRNASADSRRGHVSWLWP